MAHTSSDTQRWAKISAHLDRALDLSAVERDAWLKQLAATEPEVAAELAVFLADHRQLRSQGFLDSSPMSESDGSLSGVIIGAYTLISRIGDGGMGTVWLGRRSDGRYEGQVAIKLLNAALVGRGGEERFRREGVILARLGHPHIASLIDAGVSNTGQPYLVLELVNGEHIDAFCDERRLSIERRIRLFLDVLSAVSHAHANLIVHRDLKPSNVLVNQGGGVKLLDFSIAKLMEDNGVSRLTQDSGAALTPKYAAPEQVTGDPITTRTDVYSLGVLLYELVSGQHPYGDAVKTSKDFTRAIVDQEPLPVSAAFRKAPLESRSLVAAQRATTPDRLGRALGRELETILHKSLKKAPGERYGSVAEMADDLRRYLDDQPIAARPDTVRYRAAKFVRRHRRGVAVTTAIVTAVVAIVAFYTMQLAAERDRARLQAEKASRVSELLTSVLTSADPYRDPDASSDGAATPSARALLDTLAARIANELTEQPEVQAEMLTVIGRTYERLGLIDKAMPLLQRALEIGRRSFRMPDARVAQTLNDLGVLQRRLGNLSGAAPLLIESLSMRRALAVGEDKVAVTLSEYGRVLRELGRLDEAERATRDALAIRLKIFGDEHRETATNKSDLGQLLMERGEIAEAERLFRENLATTERVLGPEHPNTVASKNFVGIVLAAKGDFSGAEKLQREALVSRQRIFGPGNPESALAVQSLAGTLEMHGRTEEAESLLSDAYATATSALGADNPRLVNMAVDLSRVRIARGRGAESEAMLRRALATRQRTYPPGHWRIAEAQALLGASLAAQHRLDEAETLMHAADRVFMPIPGRQARDREVNRVRLRALER
ncbi:MAG TPA: serine/threonine-protein kinase [Vicinamibacterales bacterium]|nr:serine/threonine-protein kinase [Vicinamibacterales bacterium]